MKYGFIGAGNMGGAIAKAAARAVDPADIYITNRTLEKTEKLAREINCRVSDAQTIARECKYIFIGVKPYAVKDLLTGLKSVLDARSDRFILVSMATAVYIEDIRAVVGDVPVIRIMPNLPVSAGEGLTMYTAEGVTREEEREFFSLMRCSGIMCRTDEGHIDAGSAVAGCGPAFACMFAEALADGGVRCGLTRKDAQIYAAQMLLGTAKLLLDGMNPAVLKDGVCSPGGATIEGVLALERGGMRAAAADAVIAAYEKTRAMRTGDKK